jgi:hypothetical protein
MALMHPALMKRSGWTWNQRLRELLAAKWWGCPSPSYFDALSKTERADILATYECDWRISAVNSYEAQQEAERKAKQSARRKR